MFTLHYIIPQEVSKMLWQAWLQCMLCCKCCSVIFTDVYEVGPVLAGHAETKIPPEPRVLLDHLQAKERQVPGSSTTGIYQLNTQGDYSSRKELLCVWTPSIWSGKYLKTSQQRSTALSITVPTSGSLSVLKKGRREGRLDWCELPAAAPQVGCAQDSHRSEWGCTDWTALGRTPFYLREAQTAVSDN